MKRKASPAIRPSVPDADSPPPSVTRTLSTRTGHKQYQGIFGRRPAVKEDPRTIEGVITQYVRYADEVLKNGGIPTDLPFAVAHLKGRELEPIGLAISVKIYAAALEGRIKDGNAVASADAAIRMQSAFERLALSDWEVYARVGQELITQRIEASQLARRVASDRRANSKARVQQAAQLLISSGKYGRLGGVKLPRGMATEVAVTVGLSPQYTASLLRELKMEDLI